MAVVLTVVQTEQIRINIHKKNTKHSTNNTKHSKYKYTYYQNTHTIVKTAIRYETHTYTLPHIIKQVKTTTDQDAHKMKYSQYNEVYSV